MTATRLQWPWNWAAPRTETLRAGLSPAPDAGAADNLGPAAFAGLRVAKAVLPCRTQASRVPAIVRRSPCRLQDAGLATTLRRDPSDPARLRISGRLADVCATLDRLVDRQDGMAA